MFHGHGLDIQIKQGLFRGNGRKRRGVPQRARHGQGERAAMRGQIARVHLPDGIGVVRAGDHAGIAVDPLQQRFQRRARYRRAAGEGLAAVQQPQAAVRKVSGVHKKIVRFRTVPIIPERGVDGKGNRTAFRQGGIGIAIGIHAVVVVRYGTCGLIGHGIHHHLYGLRAVDAAFAAFRFPRRSREGQGHIGIAVVARGIRHIAQGPRGQLIQRQAGDGQRLWRPAGIRPAYGGAERARGAGVAEGQRRPGGNGQGVAVKGQHKAAGGWLAVLSRIADRQRIEDFAAILRRNADGRAARRGLVARMLPGLIVFRGGRRADGKDVFQRRPDEFRRGLCHGDVIARVRLRIAVDVPAGKKALVLHGHGPDVEPRAAVAGNALTQGGFQRQCQRAVRRKRGGRHADDKIVVRRRAGNAAGAVDTGADLVGLIGVEQGQRSRQRTGKGHGVQIVPADEKIVRFGTVRRIAKRRRDVHRHRGTRHNGALPLLH